MKSKIFKLSLVLLLGLTSCDSGGLGGGSSGSAEGPSASSGPGNSGTQNQPGVITAGEWNDLENWAFWGGIIKTDDFKTMPSFWSFYNNNRISVNVVDAESKPVADVPVQLKRDGIVIFNARTDNKGKAEFWVGLFKNNTNVDYSKLTIDINNGSTIISNVKPYDEGINTAITSPQTTSNNIEIAFVVDTTGSMGDELEYLKTELLDVISNVKNDNPNTTVSTSSVVYRDGGDEYITKVSNFTNDNNTTINFLKNQSAGGGGDFPEAVHAGLDKAINELQWSTNARTRLLFLVLDAPPHHNDSVITSLQISIQNATEKGIKIIPITASGINKDTEFLMRFLSLSTNGTYVFITDDSGIGNSHLVPSVGQYQVELLNRLMVRLINKYAQ